MTPDQDPYYGRSEVSNSDLSFLAKYWQGFQLIYDIQKAYRMGTLLDCMITEKERVNYTRLTCAGYSYTPEEFAVCEAMKKSFYRDDFCRFLAEHSDMQKVTADTAFQIEHLGFRFSLPFRMKADFDAGRALKMIADLKSTTATSEKAFRQVIEAFSYDRQAAVYMDLGKVNRFMLIGVSKIAPYTVFKVAIERGDPLYLSGRAKYEELAFRHYNLFGNLRIPSLRVAA